MTVPTASRSGLALAVLLLLSTLASDDRSWAQDDPGHPLGPAGERGGDRPYGVAPTWPGDRLLLAVYQDWLARSEDDGASWTRLPTRFVRPRAFWLPPGVDRSRIAFAVDLPDDALQRHRIHRSTDAGESWSVVLEPGQLEFGVERDALTFSPAFADDGLAFLRAGGGLFRTEDFGATWTPIDLAPVAGSLAEDGVQASQVVQSLRLSPAFLSDRTVFLTVGTDLYYPGPIRPDGRREAEGLPPIPSDFPTRGLGVVVSRDAGRTWSSASVGLEIDGSPSRYVAALTVSPTYADDRTLFAWAWGPGAAEAVEDEQRLTFRNAVFRSQDAGAAWHAVWDQPTLVNDVWTPGAAVRLGLSKSFGRDRTAFAAIRHPNRVHNLSQSAREDPVRRANLQTRCSYWQTFDGGSSWRPATNELGSSAGCDRLQVLSPDAPWTFALPSQSGAVGSRDGGRTWDHLGSHSGILPHQVSRGGERLFATSDGLVAHGLSGPASLGQPACPIDLAVSLLPNDPRLPLKDLGCGAEPPRSVTVRERVVGPRRGLWLEDESPSWILLTDRSGRENSLDYRWGGWEVRPKDAEPWTGPPDRVLRGMVQRAWGGLLLELRSADRERSVLMILDPRPSTTPQTSYQEHFPDRPRRTP